VKGKHAPAQTIAGARASKPVVAAQVAPNAIPPQAGVGSREGGWRADVLPATTPLSVT
jgi:hypothetical protein